MHETCFLVPQRQKLVLMDPVIRRWFSWFHFFGSINLEEGRLDTILAQIFHDSSSAIQSTAHFPTWLHNCTKLSLFHSVVASYSFCHHQAGVMTSEGQGGLNALLPSAFGVLGWVRRFWCYLLWNLPLGWVCFKQWIWISLSAAPEGQRWFPCCAGC